MTTEPQPKPILLNIPEFTAAVKALGYARQQASEARKLETEAKRVIQAHIEAQESEGGPISAVQCLGGPRLKITHSAGNPRISGEILLAEGVDPEVIQRATVRTPSVAWRVEE